MLAKSQLKTGLASHPMSAAKHVICRSAFDQKTQGIGRGEPAQPKSNGYSRASVAMKTHIKPTVRYTGWG